MEGWIKLHRILLEWEWYDDTNTKVLFLHCLLKANYNDKLWRGIEIKRGQFYTSLNSLSNELNLSTKAIRTALNKLIKTGEVIIKGANKGTMITVCKYDSYQIKENEKGKQKGKQGANKGQLHKNNDKKEINSKCLFRNSDISDYIVFCEEMKKYASGKYKFADMNFYYEAVKNWSDSGSKMKIDWKATVASFMLRDIQDNKFRKDAKITR